jgi:hypothetical protein
MGQRWWPVTPGVPAAGHLTAGGFWHPGGGFSCAKCKPTPPPRRPRPVTR